MNTPKLAVGQIVVVLPPNSQYSLPDSWTGKRMGITAIDNEDVELDHLVWLHNRRIAIQGDHSGK
jgi:hypothetical protein